MRLYLLTILVLTLFASYFLIQYEKTEIHLASNAHHAPAWDFFFKYLTYVGDGVFVVIAITVIGLSLLRSKGWRPLLYGWFLLFLSGGAAQILKRVFYSDALRPSAFITNDSLYLIDGVQMHAHHSFPSGHSTAAFAFFGFTAILLCGKRPLLQVLLALSAGLVAFSRIYLSQHFLEDILAGMLLGTFFVLAFLIADRKKTFLN